jgi:hypothetical protein
VGFSLPRVLYQLRNQSNRPPGRVEARYDLGHARTQSPREERMTGLPDSVDRCLLRVLNS